MAAQTVAVSTDSSVDAEAVNVEAVDLGPASGLSCRECGERFELGPIFACASCFGPLEVAYDLPSGSPEELRKRIEAGPANIWRYAPLLPVPADVAEKPNLNPGWTKLVQADNLARELGVEQGKLFVKDDSGNPTHSFKDRVVAQAIEAARAFGFTTLSCSSTGNLAGAVGAAAARAGFRSCVFIPHDLEQGKVVMAAVYGGELVGIEGNYDDVNRFCSELIGDPLGEGWGFVNVNLRPYYGEGSKTLAYEICEQLGWRLPDQLVIPIASGSQFTKIDKGLQELIKLGLVEDKPCKLFGAQAEELLPGLGRVQGRPRRGPAAEAEHHRQVPGDRQPGRRPVRPGHRPPHRRRGGGRERRAGRRRDQAAGAHRGHLRGDGGRCDGRRDEEAHRGRSDRPVADHRRTQHG